MTAPIDLDCPLCKSTPGNYCTSPTVIAGDESPGLMRVTFHHAARVDAAARESDRGRRYDPTRLREALRETITMLHAYVEGCNDATDRQRVAELRKEFEL